MRFCSQVTMLIFMCKVSFCELLSFVSSRITLPIQDYPAQVVTNANYRYMAFKDLVTML